MGRGRGDPGGAARAPQRHARHARALGDRPRATSTPPGCGRWPRRSARWCAPSARRPPTWTAIRSSGSRARRPSSTTGSARRNPDLYGRIRAHAESGQWLPVGGTWVEPDCNLPSGESLVRQFLHGQRFFEREFGRRCREFWNPDVFGYNGQLPQIMRGAGIGRFLTQKLSWNRFNPPPHHTFTWQGIDGSEVLAHFPPADTYNATAEVEELRRSARDYKDHDRSRRSLLVFGYGDGGGGPTPEMLETLRRARDLQGVPRTTMTTSATSSSTALEAMPATSRRSWASSTSSTTAGRTRPRPLSSAATATASGRCTTPTSWARSRRGCRRRTPRRAAGRAVAAAAAEPVPRHPARLEHRAGLRGRRPRPRRRAGGRRGDRRRRAGGARRRGRGADAVQHDRVRPRRGGRRPDGELAWVEAPAYGFGIARAPRRARCQPPSRPTGWCSRTACCGPSSGATGWSLARRRSGRSRGAGGARERAPALRRPADGVRRLGRRPVPPRDGPGLPAGRVCEVAQPGRCGRRWCFERPVGTGSAMRQVVRLDAGARRLEFHCEVDWRESHTMLKVLFPVAVRSPYATYQMQFGHAERPTHFSTSHDLARYEVPGPPLRRSLRARLRRRAPHRLQVRLLDVRERDADQPAALAARCPIPRPTSAGTSSLRRHAARRRLARGGRGGRGGAVRDAASVGPGRRGAAVIASRSTTRTWCSTP